MSQQQLTITKAEPLTVVSAEPLAVVKAEPPQEGGGFLDTAKDFAIGLGKGAFDTAGGLMRGAANMFPGMEFSDVDREHVRRASQPTNSAQGVGRFTEKAAEMIVPGARATTAAFRAIPTAARAGQKFQRVMAAAKDVPINVSEPGKVSLRIMDLAERGGSMPLAVRKFLARTTDPNKGPMTYEEARDFASNISRLSADEFGRLTPVVRREIQTLREALNRSVGGAAQSVGMGDEYASAMRQYGQAAKLRKIKDSAKDAAAKYVLPVGGAGLVAKWLFGGGGKE